MNRGTKSLSKEKALRKNTLAGVEPLEGRLLLAVQVLDWTVDPEQSNIGVDIPDQTFVYDVNGDGTDENVIIRIRNTDDSSNTAWTVGNSTQLTGTVKTEYDDGNSIKFLLGQSALFGTATEDPIFKPDPADWVPPVEDDPNTPEDESADGYFSATNFATGVIGGRIWPRIAVFNLSVAQFNFTSMQFDLGNDDPIEIDSNKFSLLGLQSGIASADVALKAIPAGIFGDILDDTYDTLDQSLFTNDIGGEGTIITPDPINNPNMRKMTIPFEFVFMIDVTDDVALEGTISGQLVATATLNEQGPPAEIVGRHIFYNQSAWDGLNATGNAADSAAIATDKSPYEAGQGLFPISAMTNYTKGINGIMVDIQGDHGEISADDFVFRMSNGGTGVNGPNTSPDTWAAAPGATVITLADTPSPGTDRVVITFPNDQIKNRYLQVNMLANADTNLAEPATWYYGNKAGDTFTGSVAALWNTGGTDEVEVRGKFGAGALITSAWDFDRNKINGTAVDQQAARLPNFGFLTRITLAPTLAPEAVPATAGDGDGSGSAIVSALAMTSVSSDALAVVPSRLVQRLDVDSTASSAPQSESTALMEGSLPGSLADASSAVDEALDDELLDSLLD